MISRPRISADRRERFRRSGVWSDRTLLDDVSEAAAKRPSRTAVADGDGRYTYGELVPLVDRLAAGMADRGVAAGHVVTIALPGIRQFVPTFLAVQRLGAIVMPVLPTLPAGGLEVMARLGQPTFGVAAAAHRRHRPAAAVGEAIRRAGLSEVDLAVVGMGSTGHGTPWEELGGTPRGEFPRPSGDDLVELAFTSGTTGEPKGVFHTHNTALAGIRSTVRRQGITAADVVHVALPVGHNFGYFYGVQVALAAGATVVLQDRWDVDTMLRMCGRFGVTVTSGTPTHLVDLLDARSRWDGRLDTLRLFTVAGAPCPPELARRAVEELPGRLSRAFGMTETGHVTATGPDATIDQVIHTEGSPQPEVELAILASDGTFAPVGTRGQVAFGGPFITPGYVQGPAFTRQHFTDDGLFLTGDLGSVDDDGCLRISGRAKDVIIRGGENIPVAEVESALREHGDVADVVVIGVPDRRLGESALACVVPSPGRRPSLESLQHHLEERGLPRHQWPEDVRLVERLPRNPTGKVVRDQLRRHVLEGTEHGRADTGP